MLFHLPCNASLSARELSVPDASASRHLLREVLSSCSLSLSALCPSLHLTLTRVSLVSLHHLVSLPIFLLSWTVRSLTLDSVSFSFLFFFIYWAVSGLSCSMQALHCSTQAPECVGAVGAVHGLSSLIRGLSSLTRD